MEPKEIKEIRRQIREMLFNSDDVNLNFGLKNKENFIGIKDACYKKIIDLKGKLESYKDEQDNLDIIKKIDEAIITMTKLKNTLSKQID